MNCFILDLNIGAGLICIEYTYHSSVGEQTPLSIDVIFMEVLERLRYGLVPAMGKIMCMLLKLL